jgi:hypothetical protein
MNCRAFLAFGVNTLLAPPAPIMVGRKPRRARPAGRTLRRPALGLSLAFHCPGRSSNPARLRRRCCNAFRHAEAFRPTILSALPGTGCYREAK